MKPERNDFREQRYGLKDISSRARYLGKESGSDEYVMVDRHDDRLMTFKSRVEAFRYFDYGLPENERSNLCVVDFVLMETIYRSKEGHPANYVYAPIAQFEDEAAKCNRCGSMINKALGSGCDDAKYADCVFHHEWLKSIPGTLSGDQSTSEDTPTNETVTIDAPQSKEKSNINPNHYQSGDIQAIDVIDAFDLGFDLGNAVKYILRAGKKDSEEQDLKKAIWYIMHHLGMEPHKNQHMSEVFLTRERVNTIIEAAVWLHHSSPKLSGKLADAFDIEIE